MNRSEPLRVLLVEDDEDDFVLTQSMLLANGRTKFDLEWEQSYADALDAVRVTSHDLYLVDYRLGEHTGLDLVRTAWGTDPPAPVILLTGQDDYAVDMEATALGVTDYLVKGTIDAPSLERTIRYAVRQHQAMVDLRRSEERYAVAVRATNDGIWDWDLTAECVHFSERWKTLLGHDDLSGEQMAAWFELVHPDDLERLRHEIDGSVAGASPYFENEHRIRHGDGSWRWVLCRGLSTCDAAGAPVRITGSLSDITERRNAEERLIHDALHDSLTGLPNRTLLMDRVTHCVHRGERAPTGGCAVLYIDLDRFKLINDSVSHAAGDRLLIELARRMEEVLRPGDTLARLGGDEFAVVLEGISSAAQALEIGTRLCQTIAQSVPFEHRALQIVGSIGIAHNLDGIVSPEVLLRNADIAMYDAKGHGGGRCAVFDHSMHQRVVDRMSLETHLRQAIEQRRLRTFFQPIVDLSTGAIRGLEALARWPAGELDIPPVQFIPVAEESGLIGQLGALVLRDACRTLSDWRTHGLVSPEVTVSVNVSVRQLMDSGIVDHVRGALADSGLSPENLVLEITESTLIDNPQVVSTVLGELLALGVTVELDDFGTGYSSLTVLHDFPGHTLKIDRAFVDTMIDRPESETIVRSIVSLAHSLGLRVTAEGIEDTDQLNALTALGCEYGQGYHFSRPLPAADIVTMLAAPSPLR
ncbi:MAG TPA: EAL domain-containing protein [Solirubrobacteraceae bacterium]|jgi:diguanylate cyclase (GGDEF)-like protein/PAS domain S-box-containing protein|nr:EAL domain-containing protein [Solirubrobacteraceae bacterium]